MPILIKNESFNNIFLWKLCFIENNSFLCIIKLKKRRIMKYVIIGGVAGGATAAARLRRVDEMAEILLLEKGPYISYANCGLPYYIGGVIAEREKLLVQTPESFGKRFRIDVFVCWYKVTFFCHEFISFRIRYEPVQEIFRCLLLFRRRIF